MIAPVTRKRMLAMVQLLATFVGACSSPPQAHVDAAASSRDATSRHPPEQDAGGQAVPGDASTPDPMELLHDAIAFDARRDFGLHRLKILPDDIDRIGNDDPPGPYISEDGSTAVVYWEESNLEPRMQKYVALVWPLDAPEKARKLAFLERRQCNVGQDSVPCDHTRAEASVRPINAILAKHRWAEFHEFDTRPTWNQPSYCGRTLRVRAAGYTFEFRSTHLRVTAPDGTLFIDRSDITPDPTAGPLDKCAAAEEAVISTIGIDVKRRAMFLDLNACRPKDCPGTLRTLFFRLPKTSK